MRGGSELGLRVVDARRRRKIFKGKTDKTYYKGQRWPGRRLTEGVLFFLDFANPRPSVARVAEIPQNRKISSDSSKVPLSHLFSPAAQKCLSHTCFVPKSNISKSQNI